MAYVITTSDFNEVKISAPYEKYSDALRELVFLFSVHNEGALKKSGKIVGDYKKAGLHT